MTHAGARDLPDHDPFPAGHVRPPALPGVTRVVMEATSDYWRPAFCLLEAVGFEAWLVNARDVKHLPGQAARRLLSLRVSRGPSVRFSGWLPLTALSVVRGAVRWPGGSACGVP